MELYIQIRNGGFFEHPILGDNFRMAYPEIDVNNLPPQFATFSRYARPSFTVLPEGPYQVTEVRYIKDGTGGKDEWYVRNMTTEEKQAKINVCSANRPYPSWTFDEPTCQWISPSPSPKDGRFVWDEATLSWIDMTSPEMQLSAVSFV